MLTELRIKNFAIIESLSLPLAAGFNVLSGETGAGKSIIVDALGLLLGERANSDMIRTGTDKATVEGTFEIGGDKTVARLLDDRGIEVEDGLVVLKREVSSSGRGRAWINGGSVTAAVLADVGRLLVNLHGQHEAQTLIDQDSQRRILDAFAGASDSAAEVKAAHEELSLVRRTITDLSKRRGDAEKRSDFSASRRRSATRRSPLAKTSDSRMKRVGSSMPTSCASSPRPPRPRSTETKTASSTRRARSARRSRLSRRSTRRLTGCLSCTTPPFTTSKSWGVSSTSISARSSSIRRDSRRCVVAVICCFSSPRSTARRSPT
jgi:hypothetical protein